MTIATAARSIKGTNDMVPIRVNLAAWYRFRRGLTNQSGCSSWADMSGNSRPLLQATASLRPALLASGELVFDGASHTMAAAFTLAQPCTIYMLFRQITWTSGDIILDGNTGTAKLTQSSGTQGIVANAGSALSAGTAIGLNSYGISCVVWNSTTSVYQSAGGGPSVTITGDANTNTPGGITVGSDRSGTNPANIGVREVCVFTGAHDATTRLSIIRYLGRVAGTVGGIM